MSQVMIMNKEKGEILLGMKKRGFAAGRWDGYGGKQEVGETIEECAVRETLEECGVVMTSYEKVGRIVLKFTDKPLTLNMHVFRCDAFEGDVVETEEMRPQWFSFDKVPYQQMWPTDPLWYEHLIKGNNFEAYFVYDGHSNVVSHEVKLADNNNVKE